MDNFSFSIQSDSIEDFELAMKLVFTRHEYVIAYKIDKDLGMILYGHSTKVPKNATYTLYLMDIKDTISFTWGWLKKVDYGREPDLDGDCKKGFRVSFEPWSNALDEKYMMIIKPVWALYHK